MGLTFIDRGTVKEALAFLDSTPEKCLDIETSRKFKRGEYREDVYAPGLDPRMSRVVLVQIGNAEDQFVIDTRRVDISPIVDRFDEGLWISHNSKFEQKHLKHTFGKAPKKVYDTMLVDIIQNNGANYSFSLEALSKRHLGAYNAEDVTLFTSLEEEYARIDKLYIDKSIRMGFINCGDRPFTTAQIEYGATDIIAPMQIREKQLANPYFPKAIDLEHRFVHVLADMELRGMPFDPIKWLEIYEKDSLPKYIGVKDALDWYVVENYPQFTLPPYLFSSNRLCSIDWSSPQQVIKFFRFLDICPKEKSKFTGRLDWSASAKAMNKVLNTHKGQEYRELIENYLRYKELQLLCTTFGKDYLKYIHPKTGRIHPDYRQLLISGRIAASHPNLQQVPDGPHRECFVGSFVDCDYSSQEIVIAANRSGDEAMIEALTTGDGDIHSTTATKMFRLINKTEDLLVTKASAKTTPDHYEMRQTAKIINFKIMYGGSAYTLKDDLKTDEIGAQGFIDAYFSLFPGLQYYFEDEQEKALESGEILIDEITGRKYFYPYFDKMKDIKKEVLSLYPENWSELNEDKREEVKAELKPQTSPLWSKYYAMEGLLRRRANNLPIQGTSASVTKLAAILLYEKGVKIVHLVHDEIIAETDTPEITAKIVKYCMEEAGAYWCKLVPLKADPVITKTWRH